MAGMKNILIVLLVLGMALTTVRAEEAEEDEEDEWEEEEEEDDNYPDEIRDYDSMGKSDNATCAADGEPCNRKSGCCSDWAFCRIFKTGAGKCKVVQAKYPKCIIGEKPCISEDDDHDCCSLEVCAELRNQTTNYCELQSTFDRDCSYIDCKTDDDCCKHLICTSHRQCGWDYKKFSRQNQEFRLWLSNQT